MRRSPVVVLVVALVICGCSLGPRIATRLSEEDQIREAVFRYQFEFNASGLGTSANAYFLCVEGGGDPSPELLQQFRRHRPTVKPASASALQPGTAQVVDSDSGLPSLLFLIRQIRQLGTDSAEVEGGYEEASESGSGNVFRLERRDGRWQVVEARMLWIK